MSDLALDSRPVHTLSQTIIHQRHINMTSQSLAINVIHKYGAREVFVQLHAPV